MFVITSETSFSEYLPDLLSMMDQASSVVFFGGAGMSTDSGIPDFRGSSGLYTAPDDLTDPPEYLLSHTCLVREPLMFFRYYRRHMIYPDARPNAAHIALADMERAGKLTAVVTQNIDGLHTLAGNACVYEVHGTTLRNYCETCGRVYPREAVTDDPDIPHCSCGGVIRPDVVLYGEGLDDAVFSAAARAVAHSDLLIVGGTSLTVYPAASLVELARGRILIVNRDPTPYDRVADAVIRLPLSRVLPALAESLGDAF